MEEGIYTISSHLYISLFPEKRIKINLIILYFGTLLTLKYMLITFLQSSDFGHFKSITAKNCTTKHSVFSEIQPTTGLIISAQSKLQINLVIRNTKKFQQLSHIPNVLLPLVFFNESVNLNASTINELNMKLNRIPSNMYFISIFSIIFNVLLLCIIMMKSYIQKLVVAPILIRGPNVYCLMFTSPSNIHGPQEQKKLLHK
ncbi:hypothetical protein KSF78_0005805 [Schistosoma japonicum]|nr:hypothetical protein KSF78_0005805 [Schistosoma japonicum]